MDKSKHGWKDDDRLMADADRTNNKWRKNKAKEPMMEKRNEEEHEGKPNKIKAKEQHAYR